MSNLRQVFKEKIFNEIKTDLKISNPHLVPKLEKIVINLGIGYTLRDAKLLQQVKEDVFKICGQRPLEIKARKSVADFKVREGMVCALQVTLRRNMMYDFLERLIYLALPQTRSFFGFNDSGFQGDRVFSLGIQDCTIFPEMPYREKKMAMGINIVTTSRNKEECKALLKKFKFPFLD